MTTDLERHQPEAVDPRSGEVIDLANAPAENLVEAFLVLQDHERRAKEWRTAVEDELVRRVGEKVTDFVGDWQLDISRGWAREWDVDDLEREAAQLVKLGAFSLRDVAGLIKTTRSVDGNVAKRLLGHQSPKVQAVLKSCFRWEQKGRAKVKVTPVQQLEQ